jgi:hypothetical protein
LYFRRHSIRWEIFVALLRFSVGALSSFSDNQNDEQNEQIFRISYPTTIVAGSYAARPKH